ncbi:hypothetical protein SEA_WOFFORD_204 [Streptomyces phage Wofford]|uniref:Uncharacterized protein n=1 Tax=Streptomyces phage Wofford TaxID=2283267 RepID=A0A345MA25_9CAUD|nr:hypothetical protein HWB78_gp109 [Streptomyces phage Wollford]AXH67346.1 hypothetical protein SEA_WOFFORD_204 [Streptomyces phage Wollford]
MNPRKMAADAVKNKKCVKLNAYVGCGKSIDPDTEFNDQTSAQEYMITGLCQSCQDRFYGDLDE